MKSDVEVTDIVAGEKTNNSADDQSVTSVPSSSHSTESENTNVDEPSEDGQENVDTQINNLGHRRKKKRNVCRCRCRCRCCKMCRLWKVAKTTLFPMKKVLSEMSCYH
ncbi:unnamed protein product [Ceutorhynchus assimilis]|uniref:Uncharacterized protein n=1 Tax=Ceutorhynchus assimilis TaxID=467358 RepID=A0A9N9QSC5_9CUCU|nr:unnamed protein product [Ceutorhynchus assimilis]